MEKERVLENNLVQKANSNIVIRMKKTEANTDRDSNSLDRTQKISESEAI